MQPVATEKANAPIVKIMYKICCTDVNITDVYVGQTVNIKSRRYHHKQACENENDKRYNGYVYKFIRSQGGWSNWSMVPIETYTCSNKIDVAIRERYWIETLNATLNTAVPGRTSSEYKEANKHKVLQWERENYVRNRDRIIQHQKDYYLANKDARIQYSREYRNANKESIKQYQQKYRAKK